MKMSFPEMNLIGQEEFSESPLSFFFFLVNFPFRAIQGRAYELQYCLAMSFFSKSLPAAFSFACPFLT